jgi:hypothetical protein
MAYGSNKKGDSSFSKGQQALVPYNFSMPGGQTTVTPGKKGKGGTVNYQSFLSPDQKATQGLTDSKIMELINGMPTNVGVNDLYNNPFYQSTYDYGARELGQQKNWQLGEMNNELAARNQIGSSYDALRRRNFDDQYSKAYADLGDRSRTSAADAYTQALNMRLAGLSGLRNDRGAALQAEYLPFQMSMGYQQALTPLQAASANLYSQQGQLNYNRPSGIAQAVDLYAKYLNANANAMSAAGGMGGGGGGGG